MPAVSDEVTALRAENARLKELMASKDALLAGKDEVIASKTAQLSTKDEVIVSKVEVNALLLRTVEELQQYKHSVLSSKPAAAADSEHDAQQPSSKWQRMCNHSSSGSRSSSSFEAASPIDKDEILDHVLGCVGGVDHLYVGGVSRRWKGRYMQYCVQSTTSAHDKKLVTRQHSVLMSASRLQLAISSGCEVSKWTFEK
jgi:hypothetical protein